MFMFDHAIFACLSVCGYLPHIDLGDMWNSITKQADCRQVKVTEQLSVAV